MNPNDPTPSQRWAAEYAERQRHRVAHPAPKPLVTTVEDDDGWTARDSRRPEHVGRGKTQRDALDHLRRLIEGHPTVERVS
jgi:hypothetical protein